MFRECVGDGLGLFWMCFRGCCVCVCAGKGFGRFGKCFDGGFGCVLGCFEMAFSAGAKYVFKSSPSVNQRLGLSTRVFSTSRIMGICELGKLGVARGKLEAQKKHSWRYGRM